MKTKKPSSLNLVNNLIDAVQDLNAYYGRSGGRKDDRFREFEKAVANAKSAVRKRMFICANVDAGSKQ